MFLHGQCLDGSITYLATKRPAFVPFASFITLLRRILSFQPGTFFVVFLLVLFELDNKLAIFSVFLHFWKDDGT